ncbi:uncharacterized protein LOC132610944 [Lycium barbarum]|uniref:uncharacterized protein LOC132610944 n=1 Tax=Lycium barbarum TaxID=112863 RepID=UPI00293ED14F|nr:uncharacterized protein LOC132610944 [Lycium barbarum]
MPGIPKLEWKGTVGLAPKHIVSFLKAHRMVEKGCLAHLEYIHDTSTDTPPLELIPIMTELPEVFPTDLPGILPDRDINFHINVDPGTKPISIPPYQMALIELKELKEKLQDLLSKGSKEENERHLGIFLETLREKRLYAKFSKCDLWLSSVAFLEHMVSKDGIMTGEGRLAREVQSLANSLVRLDISEPGRVFACVEGNAREARLDEEGIMSIKGRICTPQTGDLTVLFMEEAPNSTYSIHPGAMKMYRDLKQHYWWCSMKRDNVKFVSRCLNCQQVKYEHQKPGGISQRMPILEWKWERIAMEFLMIYTFEKLAKIYIHEILYLHGLPVSIIYDRQTQFTSYFWKYLQKELGTRVELRTTFHPQTDGQSERIIQVLEDMLRYISNGSHVIRWDSVMLDQNLSYKEESIAILDHQIRKLRSKEIASVKFQW